MGNARSLILVILLLALALIGANSVFIVSETQLAIKLKFGEVLESNFEPGLYFKYPIAHTVYKFDKRIQNLDSQPSRFLTSEKKNLMASAFVKWRVTNAELFYTKVSGSVTSANVRLAQMLNDALREEFSRRELQEAVSSGRVAIMQGAKTKVAEKAIDLGIAIVDVRLIQVDLPERVSSSVFDRMAAERKKVAKEFRAEGDKEAATIEAQADRERVEVLARAYREAETLRGEGDAEATAIYASAYNKDAEFYRFVRSLQAYKSAFQGKDDVLVLSPDSEFFQYLNSDKRKK